METILTSSKNEIRIGPDHPFVIVGERINPTGRKTLAAEMAAGDFTRVESDAQAQVQAGAQMLDVNAGIPLADEADILAEAVRRVQSVVDVPLSIDSSVVEALQAGLEVYQGKPLVNSVTAEEDRLERVLPLVKKYDAAVIGICNDESGISEQIEERFLMAKKILERALDHGIPREDVILDPLAMPVGAVSRAGVVAFELMRRCRHELGLNTICGASNISFGLPGRPHLNAAFLAMAITNGLPCAITNPLEEEVKTSIMAADVMMGRDENCGRWLSSQRSAAQNLRRSERRVRRRNRL